jgi:bifunctional non-homologous end joining protein LigD
MGELKTYRAKRDARRTPEPVPRSDRPARRKRSKPGNDRFVIQEHHARALHWDFRLERDGVLVSWAVPKNLPVDPTTNHLAVHTEDHPMEYLDFAGDIPAGEYGGGNVTIWDRGTYQTEKWNDREVMVVLDGSRVSGRYVLFKTGSRDRDWMVHRMDPPAAGFERMPTDLHPMLASDASRLPRDDGGWGYEFDWSGLRAVVYVEGGRPRALDAAGEDVTGSYPELREMAAAIGSQRLILDGELVAMDGDGRPDPEGLRTRVEATERSDVQRRMKRTPITYLIYDLLYRDGTVMLDHPYRKRRAALEKLKLSGACWYTTPWFREDGAAVRDTARKQGLPGVVAKRLDAAYSPGTTSKDWRRLGVKR